MGDRLMAFVDGSNLLITTGKVIHSNIRAERPPPAAIDLCTGMVRAVIRSLKGDAFCYDCTHIRTYWFGSVQGSGEDETALREHLSSRDVEPVIYPRKGGKEKRVDIAIAREMLLQAFGKNYDLALLVAGDADYTDLVGDVKRLGVRVIGSFFKTKELSDDLRRSFDYFHELHMFGDDREQVNRLITELNGRL